MKKINRKFLFELLIGVGFSLLFFLFFRKVTIQPGDDEIFIGYRQQYRLVEFVLFYYKNWNGRIFSNTLIYIFSGLPIIYWQIFMSIILSIFGRTLFYFFSDRVFEKPYQRYLIFFLCYFGLFLFSSAVLIPSVFWFTGSLSYIVPATFALIAFIPFFNMLQSNGANEKPSWILFIVPTICASLSGEQTSVALILFTLGAIFIAKIRKINIPNHIYILFALIIGFSLVLFLAPGNYLRIQQEAQSWFKDFADFDLMNKLLLAFGFLLATMINQWYYLLGLIWAGSALLIILKNKKWYSYVLFSIFIGYASLMAARFLVSFDLSSNWKILETIKPLFSIPITAMLGALPISGFLIYLFWGIGFLLLPISWIRLSKEGQKGYQFSYLFLVALALLAAIGFSPTIFVSGARTSLIPNIILLGLLIWLNAEDKRFFILTTPTLILCLFKMIQLIYRWQTNGFFVDYGLLDFQNLFIP